MKFETEYGLGEICGYGKIEHRDTDARMDDLLVKIIAITIDEIGQISYLVESTTTQYGMQRFYTIGKNLDGDPDYDQEAGGYSDGS
jgi:hypothetical protein